MGNDPLKDLQTGSGAGAKPGVGIRGEESRLGTGQEEGQTEEACFPSSPALLP